MMPCLEMEKINDFSKYYCPSAIGIYNFICGFYKYVCQMCIGLWYAGVYGVYPLETYY